MRNLCIIILLSVGIAVHGQDIMSEAQAAFDMGHFEQADSILLNNMEQISTDNQVSAYRLLALSSLYQDSPTDAETYIGKLLSVDPYYSAYGETPRFVDILQRLKKGKTVITTASKIEESAEEVPVPVTLITEEMIVASGARTLSELLMLYVPGLSAIGSIEDNVAMRGVSGLTQEHILVMLDGHRLNSYSTNAEAFDFRNSMEKIKQIEVLRGPASSLYGNVALTAVVNIITKRGAELDGCSITAKAGMHNSYGGSVIYGHGNLQSDIMAWASLYTSQGEKRWENGTQRYIGGYNNKPTYDLGANIRWGDFRTSVTAQHTKTVPYYNLIDVGNYFSYDKYRERDGEKPGVSRSNVRIDLDYSHTFGDFSLSASAYAAHEHVQIYNVVGDTLSPLMGMQLLYLLGLNGVMQPHTDGVWQTIKWEDYSFGSSLNAAYTYRLSENMHGSLVGGVQYDYFKLIDASFNMGYDYEVVSLSSNRIFIDGDEQTISAFLQLKHNFSKKLIFNGGLRYDHRRRNDLKKMDILSPRVALIYLPNSSWSIKGTYSHSYVDAPYLYRASTISLLSGGSNLKSERMDAIQVGATANIKPLNLRCELNCFYNSVHDLVFFTSNDINSDKIFDNTGHVDIGGVEGVVQYTAPQTMVHLNATYQYPFKVENFTSTAHDISNVPRFLLNVVATQQLISTHRFGSLWVRANMHCQSRMNCLDNDLMKSSGDSQGFITVNQPAFVVFGAGMEWRSPFRLTASVDTYNLLNKRYVNGGRLQQGSPAQGFSLVGRLKYEF